MKLIKIVIMMTLMFSAASQVYAIDENADAPCTAVTESGGDDAPVVNTDGTTPDAGTDVSQ